MFKNSKTIRNVIFVLFSQYVCNNTAKVLFKCKEYVILRQKHHFAEIEKHGF